MDKTTPIVPTFAGDLNLSAAALCDFFLIEDEAKVPVTKINLIVDGTKHKLPVDPTRRKTALFLLYCTVLKQSLSFDFDSSFRDMLEPYFGSELIQDAKRPETTHILLRFLVIGKEVQVGLALKPGYDLPQGPGRTLRKLIQYGSSRIEQLRHDTPAPLLREALKQFRTANQNGTIQIIQNWNPEVWPSLTWQDRAWVLCLRLGPSQRS